MRVLQSIISTICAILIVICSIAQFHHHSHDGSMVVFSYDNVISCDHNNHQHHSTQHLASDCTYSHGCNDGHHQDEKNCSLKINIVKPESKQFSKIILACMIITDFFVNACNIIRVYV